MLSTDNIYQLHNAIIDLLGGQEAIMKGKVCSIVPIELFTPEGMCHHLPGTGGTLLEFKEPLQVLPYASSGNHLVNRLRIVRTHDKKGFFIEGSHWCEATQTYVNTFSCGTVLDTHLKARIEHYLGSLSRDTSPPQFEANKFFLIKYEDDTMTIVWHDGLRWSFIGGILPHEEFLAHLRPNSEIYELPDVDWDSLKLVFIKA